MFEAPFDSLVKFCIEQDCGCYAGEIAHCCWHICRAALFGKDFSRHVAAAEMLASDLPANMDAVVCALDLLFRCLRQTSA